MGAEKTVKKIFFIIIMLLISPDDAISIEIKKVKASKIERQMVFTFDVTGKPEEEVQVDLAIVVNGKTYTSKDLYLKGDIGKITTGKNKQIQWNIFTAFPEGLYTPVYWDVFEKNSFRDPITGIEFVFIKGGCFMMGDETAEEDEKPVHEVCVDDFYMSKYEITNEQFWNYNLTHNSSYFGGLFLNAPMFPVVNVSWFDAETFTKWLSQRTGVKYRLPTEAEWEYAARGGANSSRFWGDSPDDACSYANVADKSTKSHFFMINEIHNCDDGYKAVSPVGRFKPNKFGLYDMLGNVWEWVSDWYKKEYYSESPKKNPKGPQTGEAKVIRGGSWYNEPPFIRLSIRDAIEPSGKDFNIGFRIAFTPVKK